MKSWSVTSLAVIVLSLASWLLVYRLEGTPPTPGITLVLVGIWLGLAYAVRWFRGRS
jgi:uncharacterized membrane-anchored protein